MRLRLFLFLAFFTVIANAQNVNIPNANFKNKLLAANASNQIARNLGNSYFKIDANSDGEIQETEAQQVSWLDVSGSNIISLTGIEEFTNLLYLDFGSNYVSTLDIDNMTQLQELRCNNNEFDVLDVNMLINLKVLVCYSNDLLTLDVVAITGLEQLYCYNNELTSLNLGNKPNLTYLVCWQNALTSLDVSNFSSLTNLYCYENLLTSLDVSGTSAMTDFRCYSNNLSMLDITDAINLQFLDCSENQLSEIDLSNQMFLEDINIDFNNLMTLDVSPCLFMNDIVCHNNPNLIWINMKNGSQEDTLYMTGCPNLAYICCDPEDLAYVQNQISISTPSCVATTDCALSTGGTAFNDRISYPNPANGTLFFNPSFQIGKIELYDVSGRLLLSKATLDNKADITGFSAGTYIVKMHSGTHTITEKIIISN